MFIIVPNLLNVDLKNSSVIELLPPTNIVMSLRVFCSGTGSGELGADEVVLEVEETKLLYKFYNHKKFKILLMVLKL